MKAGFGIRFLFLLTPHMTWNHGWKQEADIAIVSLQIYQRFQEIEWVLLVIQKSDQAHVSCGQASAYIHFSHGTTYGARRPALGWWRMVHDALGTVCS